MGRSLTARTPRVETYRVESSNPSYPIPWWAQGGRSIVFVSGVGPGGSGAISTSSSTAGEGGSAGGIAYRVPVLIPSGVSTMNLQIGVPGAAVSATGVANGNNGGDSVLTLSTTIITLRGGRGGGQPQGVASAAHFGSANSYRGGSASDFLGQLAPTQGGISLRGPLGLGLLIAGATGQSGSNIGYGEGGHSPFGQGGAGREAAPFGSNVPGNAGLGFGSGGSGAHYNSGGAVSSGAGAPGLWVLEFAEVMP